MSVNDAYAVPGLKRVQVSVWRQPFGEAVGIKKTYEVEMQPGDHVLNLLWRLRRLVDPSLVFPDHYCKVGTCGACALMVDGRPALACRTIVRDGTDIAPPKGRTVVADLLAVSRHTEKDSPT